MICAILKVLILLWWTAQLSAGGVFVGQTMTDVKRLYPSLLYFGQNSQGLRKYWLTDSVTILSSRNNTVVAIVITHRKTTVQGIAVGDTQQRVFSRMGEPQLICNREDALPDGGKFAIETWQYTSKGVVVGFSKPKGRRGEKYTVGSILLFEVGAPIPSYPR